jgi:quercetin 2,3-dioxygenase
MNIKLFPSSSRGRAEHGWLHSRFSYSFAEYFNPQRMGFGMLRVLNDDIIEPDGGFGMHPHNNMEIITIPLSGSLEHRDSMGNGSVIVSGEVQVMSAGSGITHSEYNPSKSEKVNLFQIWIVPNKKNVVPRYDQRAFDLSQRMNSFQLLVGPTCNENSLFIHQDAFISAGRFDAGFATEYKIKKTGNGLFLMVISGTADVGRNIMQARDAAEISNSDTIEIKALGFSEILLIEVPLV